MICARSGRTTDALMAKDTIASQPRTPGEESLSLRTRSHPWSRRRTIEIHRQSWIGTRNADIARSAESLAASVSSKNDLLIAALKFTLEFNVMFPAQPSKHIADGVPFNVPGLQPALQPGALRAHSARLSLPPRFFKVCAEAKRGSLKLLWCRSCTIAGSWEALNASRTTSNGE